MDAPKKDLFDQDGRPLPMTGGRRRVIAEELDAARRKERDAALLRALKWLR